MSDTFSCRVAARFMHEISTRATGGKERQDQASVGLGARPRGRSVVLPFLSSGLLPSLVGSKVGMDPWERSWRGAGESSGGLCDLMRESK